MAIYKELVRKISVPSDKKIKQKAYLEAGSLPIIDQGHSLIGGYTNDITKAIECDYPVIVFGDHTKCVKFITFPFAPGADGIKVLGPKHGVLPKYLYYGTQYLTFRIENKGYARHYQHIEKKELAVPTISEQKRIVSKIEELFSKLDASVAELQTAKEKLKVYRQAVITQAFPALSEENTVKLIDIASVSGGITKGRKLDGCDTVTLPYLRVANVQNGFLDLREIKSIQLKEFEKDKYLLEYGDVLYTEGGDRDKLGRGTVWRSEIENCVHQNHVFKARLNLNYAIPEYVAYWSMSTPARNYFYKKGKQSVNLASINKTVLSNLMLPLPSVTAQQKIIESISARISVADNIEQSLDTSLQQAEALRQSILKQAFEGRI